MRWLRAVRPLEYVMGGFVLFVVAWAGPAAFSRWGELAGQRTLTVLFALGLVSLLGLGQRFARTAWPPGSEVTRRRHARLLPVVLLPLFIVAGAVLKDPELWAKFREAPLAELLAMATTAGLHVLGFGLPAVMLWVAVGLDVQRHGALDASRFLRESAVGLARALREWGPLLFALSAYAWMDAVVQGPRVPGRDALMASIDRAMFGGVDPLDLLERVISRPLSEWLAFSYSFYAVLYPLVLGVLFFQARPGPFREASFAIGAALFIAYVGYALVPVKGPLLTRGFSVSLDYWVIGAVKEAAMDATRITWDCFPSMHTCASALMGWAAWRHARRLFWGIAPMVVSMPLACVYLRYHYVVDVLAGLTLAALMVALTLRLGARVTAPEDAASTGR